jgi:hypothetical protein
MAKRNLSAQGSTITFGSQLINVRRITHRQNSNEVDVTDLDSTEDEVIGVLGSRELSVEVLGTPTLSVGDHADTTFVTSTGKTFGPIHCEIMSIETATEAKGIVSTSITLKRTPSA